MQLWSNKYDFSVIILIFKCSIHFNFFTFVNMLYMEQVKLFFVMSWNSACEAERNMNLENNFNIQYNSAFTLKMRIFRMKLEEALLPQHHQ